MRCDYPKLKELSEEGRALCKEHAIEYWLPLAEFLPLWAEAKMEPAREAVGRLERALSAFERLTSWANLPMVLALFASACLDAGEVMRGLHAVERGLDRTTKNNERWMVAELRRVEAELLAREPGHTLEETLGAAQLAVSVAREQGARWLELRSLNTALGIARRAEMDTAAYRAGLAEYCSQAREGRDTADFQLAVALLAE